MATVATKRFFSNESMHAANSEAVSWVALLHVIFGAVAFVLGCLVLGIFAHLPLRCVVTLPKDVLLAVVVSTASRSADMLGLELPVTQCVTVG